MRCTWPTSAPACRLPSSACGPSTGIPLETTMGYLILSHGVPIGYGGASALFRQVNTGINLFAEYRGSEGSFLWVQVMRVFRHLFGCTRFIANAFQFGSDNAEALEMRCVLVLLPAGIPPGPVGRARTCKARSRTEAEGQPISAQSRHAGQAHELRHAPGPAGCPSGRSVRRAMAGNQFDAGDASARGGGRHPTKRVGRSARRTPGRATSGCRPFQAGRRLSAAGFAGSRRSWPRPVRRHSATWRKVRCDSFCAPRAVALKPTMPA